MAEPAPTDTELVRRAKAGEWAAFETLVSRYERRALAVARRILLHSADAEDALQDAFTSVVEHLADFREEASFYTWLMRIVVNHSLKRLRQRREHATVPLDSGAEDDGYAGIPHPSFVAPWRETPEALARRRETRELLDQALATLDPKYRAVFVLRDVEGLSTEEAAEALKITPNNVKVRLLRARLMLRERLTRHFGDEARRVAVGQGHAH